MHLTFTGVNPAFRTLVKAMSNSVGTSDLLPTRKEDSRNGKVIVVDEPMTLTYTRPWERVLFNSARDANPFLHLYEALWMLSGSNQLAPLMYYCDRMKDYSDDGETLNGAYGYRWRKAVKSNRAYESETSDLLVSYPRSEFVDQLDIIINHLKHLPNSRRAVLTMWNTEDDLLKIGDDKNKGSLDVCCNLNVMFSLRDVSTSGDMSFSEKRDNSLVPIPGTVKFGTKKVLDMTVTNRSNDLVWGMLGTNFTTFSMLQEYMVCCLGVSIGKYHHFTNNLHTYEWNFKPDEWLKVDASEPKYSDWHICDNVPLVEEKEVFDEEVIEFVKVNGENQPNASGVVSMYSNLTDSHMEWKEPFLLKVAQPMCSAWHAHKHREYNLAQYFIDRVQAPDWKYAAQQWMNKRRNGYESKPTLRTIGDPKLGGKFLSTRDD